MTAEIIQKKQYWIEFIGFSKKHCNFTDEDLAEHIVKMVDVAINFTDSSTKLPKDEEIDLEVERIGVQKLLDFKGIYTSKELHRDIYKHSFNKAKG